MKSNYNLPQPVLNNADLTKLLHSEEIQKALRAKKKGSERTGFKRNPLKNANEMAKLDPFSVAKKRAALAAEKAAAVAKDEVKQGKRKGEEAEAKTGPSKRSRRLALEEAEKKRLAGEAEAAARR